MGLVISHMIGFLYFSKKLPQIDSCDIIMKNIDICVLYSVI